MHRIIPNDRVNLQFDSRDRSPGTRMGPISGFPTPPLLTRNHDEQHFTRYELSIASRGLCESSTLLLRKYIHGLIGLH